MTGGLNFVFHCDVTIVFRVSKRAQKVQVKHCGHTKTSHDH